MKISVKDAVLAAARALGVEDCIEVYFEGEESPLGERDAGILLECFNRIENELALEYLPLIAEEKVNSVTGVIFYSDLAYPATRILQVEAGDGSQAKYKLFPDRLETQAGQVKISYTYAPSEKTMEGEGEYTFAVASKLFLYGMVAEYFLSAGELENASAWDKKYREALRAACKTRNVKRMPARRWV